MFDDASVVIARIAVRAKAAVDRVVSRFTFVILYLTLFGFC